MPSVKIFGRKGGEMRRVLCILLFALIIITCSEARADRHGGGIKGGMLISTPSGDVDKYNVESINTITFGAFYRYSFSNLLSSQTEFIYSCKGSKGTYYASDGQINIRYLELASLIQYRIFSNNSKFGDLYVGPMVSMCLIADVEREIFGKTKSYTITDELKQTDIGLVLGAKFGFSHGSNEYGIDIRYSSGFIAPDNTGAEIDLKNRTISFMFEMYFGKGKKE